MCSPCWNGLHPDKPALPEFVAETAGRDPMRCVYCAGVTRSGIFIRIDPADATFPTLTRDD